MAVQRWPMGARPNQQGWSGAGIPQVQRILHPCVLGVDGGHRSEGHARKGDGGYRTGSGHARGCLRWDRRAWYGFPGHPPRDARLYCGRLSIRP